MESQVVRPHGHHDYEQESLPSGVHGEAEHDHGGHHDMKPAVIMKKVKDKAKKVKDKIKKHSHLHGHEHGHDHDGDQHHNSDYELDEEEGDEEMVESQEVHGAPMYDSERIVSAEAGQTETLGHTGENVKRPSDSSFVAQERNAAMHSEGTRQDNSFTQANTNPNRNLGRELEGSPGQGRLNLERSVDLEVDSAAPKSQNAGPTASNYQSKVSDPTAEGGEEIGTTTIDQSMGKMNIHNTKPSQKPTTTNEARDAISSIAPTGSHDQFSPELAPPRPQNTETYDANKPRDQEHRSSYTEQISSATSVVADKAVAAKDFVASKLGYGAEKQDAGVHGDGADKSGSYDNTKQDAGVHRDGADKSGSYDNTKHSQDDHTKHSQDDRAMDTQRSQSDSYTGKISSVAAAIPAAVAGTAMSAKNVVASKLGYGRKDDGTQEHKTHGKEQHRPSSGSGAEHEEGKEKSRKHEMEGMTQEQDKGVSAKGYFSDKLKPGDEDKALSELISESLHLQKKDGQNVKHEEKPMGKVTESEEVAKRLGTEEDQSAKKVQSTFVNSPGSRNVIDKVVSWFGGGDTQTPQQSASASSSQE